MKLKGGFTLDINLEKNRSTEAGYDTNNKIQKLDSRIDSEVSNLKAMLEAFKADSIKFIAGYKSIHSIKLYPEITLIKMFY